MSEPVHPRADASALERIETQARAIESSIERGRLHHAWLLCGPAGLGKARFAYRLARRLLGAAPDAAHGPLGSAPDDRVSRLVAARAHPDLLTLHLETDDAKPRRVIPVDEARRLPEFFAKAPSHAAYRVALIDAAEDLNGNAANAILKTLEEPPARGVLILVSHAPGRLLDTMRSRCRRLNFPPWPDAALGAWLEARGLSAEHAASARGSPGRALALAGEARREMELAAAILLDGLPSTDEAALQKLADSFRGGEGADRFAALLERLAEVVRMRLGRLVEARAVASVDAWTLAWRRLVFASGEAEALNLDRADLFWSLLADLRAAAREQPLPC